MNGIETNPLELFNGLYKAYASLSVAYDDLKRWSPNVRDYYLCPEALVAAEGEHESRLRRIASVLKELEILNSIDAQPDR